MKRRFRDQKKLTVIAEHSLACKMCAKERKCVSAIANKPLAANSIASIQTSKGISLKGHEHDASSTPETTSIATPEHLLEGQSSSAESTPEQEWDSEKLQDVMQIFMTSPHCDGDEPKEP